MKQNPRIDGVRSIRVEEKDPPEDGGEDPKTDKGLPDDDTEPGSEG